VTRQSIDDALAGGLVPEVLDSLRALSGAIDLILSGGSALKAEIQADRPAEFPRNPETPGSPEAR
jgi:hypothetical protein